MKSTALLLLPACFVLAACGGQGTSELVRKGDATRHFNCENGLSVKIVRQGSDRIELRLDDKHALLDAAVSGSGERYVAESGLFGSGAEWHQKGNGAFFSFVDPYGNRVETSCEADE